MKPFLDVLGLISASLLVRSHYRKMPILACLKSKNRSKSPFSIGLVFSIVSESTVLLISQPVRRHTPYVQWARGASGERGVVRGSASEHFGYAPGGSWVDALA